MSKPSESFPLAWPAGWKRTEAGKRRQSTYKVTLAQARDGVLDSLRLMGVRQHDVVLSSNAGGLSTREPADTGVACYWNDKDNQQRVIACDKWKTVRENLRAVGLALEALRTLERTGSSEILNRAFTGFAALPPAGEDDWRSVLGLRGMAVTSSDIEERYRQLAKDAHPDAGGDHDAMVRLNKAREAALAFLRIG
jgi:hypothetical protein